MNLAFSPLVVAAEQIRWDTLSAKVRDGFHGHGVEASDYATLAAVLAGIVAVLWILACLLGLRNRQGSYSSPRRLFLSLCRAHRLRWRECWCLWRLARSQRLSDPAKLFLEPERFHAANLTPALRAQADLLTRLRERLFEGLPGDEADEPLTPVPLESLDLSDQRRSAPPLPPLPSHPTLEMPLSKGLGIGD